VKPEDIIDEAVAGSGFSREALLGPSRKQPLARVRQEAMARCYNETDLSLPAVGRIFNRHHATVLHAVRVVARSRSQSGEQQ
jgi:chromosomal replication initiator protein